MSQKYYSLRKGFSDYKPVFLLFKHQIAKL